MRKSTFAAMLLALLGFSSTGIQAAAQVTINVYTATNAANPAALAAQFLADTTNQYNATLAPGVFANSYKLTLSDKKNVPVNLDPNTQALQNVTKQLVSISSDTFVYGYADGMDYERKIAIGRISNYTVNCSTPSVFGASTTTWNESVCTTALVTAESDIYNLKFSTPTVIPGF